MTIRQRIRNRVMPLASQLDHCTLALLCGWCAVGAISFVICGYSFYFTDAILVFPRDNVSSIVGVLIVFLGVTAAILIAAFMTAHVQTRTKQDNGFETFLESLGSFKVVVAGIKAVPERIANQVNQATRARWAKDADGLIGELDGLTPLWRGYDSDAKLECRLLKYVNIWTVPISLIAQQESDVLRIRHEQSLRRLLVGLRVLDEATVERRFTASLVKIFASLSVLLICCLLVRMAAGIGYGEIGIDSNWVNLFIYVFLTGVSIVNIVTLLYVVLQWWWRLQRRDTMWAS